MEEKSAINYCETSFFFKKRETSLI